MSGSKIHWGWSIGLAGGAAWVGWWPAQHEFWHIAGGYTLAFLGYLGLMSKGGPPVKHLFALAILARLLLWPAMPQLSDDIYRFLWDGRLILNGINPFAATPAELMGWPSLPDGITPELFARLNSPEYFTIYPPVAQGIFALSCLVFPDSIYGSTMLMKAFLFCFELGSIWLLPKLLAQVGLSERAAFWYLLNPLILVEVMGNLHFEGAMVFFLVAALWGLHREKLALSALAMALAVAAKLLPLIFMPFLIRVLGIKGSIRYFALMGAVLLLLFGPLLGQAFFDGFGSSLDLYFRRFEFNASVYYLLRWAGYQWAGYNLIAWIGPSLAAGTFFGVLLLAYKEAQQGGGAMRMGYWLAAICLYLAFTPTVHPWYVALPLLLSCFTRFRFPVAWSILVPLTYINYQGGVYHENLAVVAMEYLAVAGCGVWEWRWGSAAKKSPTAA